MVPLQLGTGPEIPAEHGQLAVACLDDVKLDSNHPERSRRGSRNDIGREDVTRARHETPNRGGLLNSFQIASRARHRRDIASQAGNESSRLIGDLGQHSVGASQIQGRDQLLSGYRLSHK